MERSKSAWIYADDGSRKIVKHAYCQQRKYRGYDRDKKSMNDKNYVIELNQRRLQLSAIEIHTL